MELVKGEFPFFRINKIKNKQGDIIFIHDFPDNSYIPDNIKDEITNFNYLAIDLPGCGVTPIIKDDKINVYHQACLLVEWVHEKEFNNIILIGHGIGSSIAIILADMIKAKIKNLILINPPDRKMFKKMHFNNNILINSQTEEIANIYNELFYYDFSNKVLETENANKKFLIFKKYHSDLTKLEKQLYNYRSFRDIQDTVKKITSPTTIIVGEDNKYYKYNKALDWYKDNMKNIDIVHFKQSSHYPFLEEPQLYFSIIKKLLDCG